MNISTLITLFLLMASPKPAFIDSPLVKEGATLQKLAGEFAFTEGPISDAEGNVYFTDQPNDRIMKWGIDQTLSTYMQPSGRANGMFMDSKGSLWVCADEKNELWKIDKNKKVTVLLTEYNGQLLNGPNDVWVMPNGSAFFTDPFYARPWWNRKDMKQDVQGVYFLSKNHKTLTRVVDDMKQPNGIIGTADGKKLYVADIGAGKTYVFDIDAKGKLSNRKLFCEKGSDGMTLDTKGNVYLTHGDGVTVYSPEGEKLLNIPTGEGWTANVCFGGKNHSTLFITASKGLYALEMNVQGIKP
ncbi:SMP-30/gluconolactonase/LRE family protein [Arundinibacter roseus]|uniref:SMP-30/gluconolactonase/LRE family protein n=1 Tax=Arundinibacter roseus TaxID=2070510 RepID=A0A4R4KFT9_9BACT|nr:SMP-30/gluconolactonase/LRE family protein [Arundinibacter roseus]TDB66874.1 SMP-30/gluconolactonase/LRE family protein [Arundinibacter roseus]